MSNYTFKDSIANKIFIPDMFGIYLNSDGTVFKILDNVTGFKLKKNVLGYFSLTLKKIAIQ